jgi:hypothetical protein
MNIVEIVKNKTAKLSYICACKAYYNIDDEYLFPIDLTSDEWKTTYLYPEYKAITLMRWIRQALEKDEVVKLK